jgi:hypothetical protein
VVAVSEELNDQSLLRLAEDWLDGTDDPGSAADLELSSHFEWLCPVEVTGCHDGISLPEFVSVLRHYL